MRAKIGMIGALAVMAAAAVAAPWARTYSMVGGTVAVTNEQANSVWTPVAVLWSYAGATTTTVTAARTSQGNTYLLGRQVVSNASTVIWVAEAEYPFEFGDVLVLTSSDTNGAAQVIRK
jgi:hypothetical protein